MAAFLAQSAFAGSPPKEDRSWKNYYNPRGSYCVDYPSRWVSGDAFEGTGFFLKPVPDAHWKSLAEIDVGVISDRIAGATLLDEAQLHLDGLRKFELAEEVRLLEQHETRLFSSPALFTSDSYYDPQNAAAMVEEVLFAEHGGMLYRLEVASRADQSARFERVFQRLVSSFQFDCPPHPVPRDFASSQAEKHRSALIARPIAASPHSVAN